RVGIIRDLYESGPHSTAFRRKSGVSVRDRQARAGCERAARRTGDWCASHPVSRGGMAVARDGCARDGVAGAPNDVLLVARRVVLRQELTALARVDVSQPRI